MTPSVRHGSVSMARGLSPRGGSRYEEAPRGVRGRARSRDRQAGFSQPPPQLIRTIPAGPQEQMDFHTALEITDRMETAERNHRLLAQTVSTEIEISKNTRDTVTAMSNDIAAYKAHVTGCFDKVASAIETLKMSSATVQSLLDTVVAANFKQLDDRINALQTSMASMEIPGPQRPANFAIGTPTASQMAFPHTAPGMSVPEIARRSNVYDQQEEVAGNPFDESAPAQPAPPSPFDAAPAARRHAERNESPFDDPRTPPTVGPAVASPIAQTLQPLEPHPRHMMADSTSRRCKHSIHRRICRSTRRCRSSHLRVGPRSIPPLSTARLMGPLVQ